MTCASATFPTASPFAARAFPPGDPRRVIGRVAIGLGTVTAGCVMAALATAVAAWMFAAVVATNPYVHAKPSSGPLTLALEYHYPALAAAMDRPIVTALATDDREAPGGPVALASDQGRFLDLPVEPAPARAETPDLTASIATTPATGRPDWTASIAASLVMEAPRVSMDDMRPRPILSPPRANQTKDEIAAVSDPRLDSGLTRSAPAKAATAAPAPKGAPAQPAKAATQLAAVAPPATLPLPRTAMPSPQPPRDAASLPGPESRTAVYDIAAHTVYLPNGEKLEAHSGRGWRLDDPRYVNEKNRGPTPPNVYGLALRGELFHGVRAIRLNPVGDADMFGRDGILAHTYMLGPSGQSFGCVSFKDYNAFLRAFLRGEVDRMIVVSHLGSSPEAPTITRRRHHYRYALDD